VRDDRGRPEPAEDREAADLARDLRGPGVERGDLDERERHLERRAQDAAVFERDAARGEREAVELADARLAAAARALERERGLGAGRGRRGGVFVAGRAGGGRRDGLHGVSHTTSVIGSQRRKQ
jgi:hypothetical protein